MCSLLACAQETLVPHLALAIYFLIREKPLCYAVLSLDLQACILQHLAEHLRGSYGPCRVVDLSQGKNEYRWKKLHVCTVCTLKNVLLFHMIDSYLLFNCDCMKYPYDMNWLYSAPLADDQVANSNQVSLSCLLNTSVPLQILCSWRFSITECCKACTSQASRKARASQPRRPLIQVPLSAGVWFLLWALQDLQMAVCLLCAPLLFLLVVRTSVALD